MARNKTKKKSTSTSTVHTRSGTSTRSQQKQTLESIQEKQDTIDNGPEVDPNDSPSVSQSPKQPSRSSVASSRNSRSSSQKNSFSKKGPKKHSSSKTSRLKNPPGSKYSPDVPKDDKDAEPEEDKKPAAVDQFDRHTEETSDLLSVKM